MFCFKPLHILLLSGIQKIGYTDQELRSFKPLHILLLSGIIQFLEEKSVKDSFKPLHILLLSGMSMTTHGSYKILISFKPLHILLLSGITHIMGISLHPLYETMRCKGALQKVRISIPLQ